MTAQQDFRLEHTIALLSRTPEIVVSLLQNLPERFLRANEGPGTWNPYDVLGHLIHGEQTDWIPRAEIILKEGEKRPFDKFDREAMFESSKGKTLDELLSDFSTLRKLNLERLRALNLQPDDLARTGTHPSLGKVTLSQLIATWVVHDQDHLVQIIRTVACDLGKDVGPWVAYLSVLTDRKE